MTEEIWKPIPLLKNLYEASSKGRIRSKDRLVPHYKAKSGLYLKRGVILKPSKIKSGYLQVMASVEGKNITRKVHVLIADAFHGARPKELETRHIDGNRLNNEPENLEYNTKKRNTEDKYLHGVTPRGEKSGRAKLKFTQVEEIRAMIAKSNMTLKVIGDRFGVSEETISSIKNKRTWHYEN